MLEHVAAGRIGVDDDHVRLQSLDGLQERERRGKRRGDFVSRAAQAVAHDVGAFPRLVDYQHSHATDFANRVPSAFLWQISADVCASGTALGRSAAAMHLK